MILSDKISVSRYTAVPIVGVYEIENRVNNKKYVGSAVDLDKRRRQHLHYLRKNNHHNNYLQNSFNKHGEDCFFFNIIHICPIEYYKKMEQWYIDTRKFHFNISKKVEAVGDRGFNVIDIDSGCIYPSIAQACRDLDIGYARLRNMLLNLSHNTTSLRLKGRENEPIKPKTKGHWSRKKVIDNNTGIIYESITKAADFIGMGRISLLERLKGRVKNETGLEYYG